MIPALLPVALLALQAPAAPAAGALRPWTVLVHGGADNDADGPILEFLDQVRKAIDDDPGLELLLLLDHWMDTADDKGGVHGYRP